MSKHTKGPWGKKPTYNEDELAVYAGYGADRGDWGGRPDGIYPEGSFSPREIARVSKFHGNSEEMHANARMMAAAPALLETLRAVIARHEIAMKAMKEIVEEIRDRPELQDILDTTLTNEYTIECIRDAVQLIDSVEGGQS